MELLLRLITTAAAVTGAWVAVSGLQTWRAQLIGKTEYELARRLLRGALEVREQIAVVRGPFMSAGEMSAALTEEAGEKEPNVSDSEQLKKATGLVYNRRWSGVSKAMSDLRLDILEAEVIWGEPIKAAHRRLSGCVAELQTSLITYLRAPYNRPLQNMEQHFAVVYQISEDPTKDPFKAKVADAVGEFERMLRPHLSVGNGVRVVTRANAIQQPNER